MGARLQPHRNTAWKTHGPKSLSEPNRCCRSHLSFRVLCALPVFVLTCLLSVRFSLFTDVQLVAGGPGVIWTEGFVLPTLQTLCHGLCGCSWHNKDLAVRWVPTPPPPSTFAAHTHGDLSPLSVCHMFLSLQPLWVLWFCTQTIGFS